MELIAAIDLLGGRARRLVQGDYGRPVAASAEPLELARSLLEAGVRRLHVIDLDGARQGRPVHDELVGRICRLAREVAPNAQVQAGGGLRDVASVELLMHAGVDDVLLGSAAVVRPEFVAECDRRWPGRVGASLDLRDGVPAISGWLDTSPADAYELATQLLTGGASRLAITDIARDGTGAGPNLGLLEAFRSRFPTALLLGAGGVATTADIAALAGLGLDGVIVGRALLDGTLDVGEALAACAPAVAA